MNKPLNISFEVMETMSDELQLAHLLEQAVQHYSNASRKEFVTPDNIRRAVDWLHAKYGTHREDNP